MKKLLALSIICFTVSQSFAQAIKGTYAIKNVETGIVLRIKDANSEDGTPIVAYSPVDWKCVTWDFKNVEGDTYQLKNLFSGKTFQSKAEPVAGVALEEKPLVADKAAQQYEFLPTGKNEYMIRLKGTDLYVTPSDNKGTINAGILLTKKKESKIQHWTLEEQHPTM
jgi:hypothetical protein